jgi:predicted anti-sigma-YlaC factor YlaD
MMLCWLYRTMASLWLDEEESLPRFVRAHLSTCAACRHHLQLERHVHGQLAASAREEDAVMPPFLPARILSAVRAAGADGRLGSLRRPARLGSLGLAVAALAALGLGVALVQMRKSPSGQDGLDLTTVREATGESAAVILRTAGDLPRWGGLVQRPLEGEVMLAMEDGRRVLTGMVESVVPDATAHTLLQHASQLWTGSPPADPAAPGRGTSPLE